MNSRKFYSAHAVRKSVIRCQLLCPVRDNYLVRFPSFFFLSFSFCSPLVFPVIGKGNCRLAIAVIVVGHVFLEPLKVVVLLVGGAYAENDNFQWPSKR